MEQENTHLMFSESRERVGSVSLEEFQTSHRQEGRTCLHEDTACSDWSRNNNIFIGLRLGDIVKSFLIGQ